MLVAVESMSDWWYKPFNGCFISCRHCLWIVGNAHTLYKSGTEWTDLVADAERRNCVFSATNDAAICKLILQVKQELDELDDLLNADSAVFSNTRWKVGAMVLASLTLNILSCFFNMPLHLNYPEQITCIYMCLILL
jgi:hypothetical protein